jgi:hypothetical protein
MHVHVGSLERTSRPSAEPSSAHAYGWWVPHWAGLNSVRHSTGRQLIQPPSHHPPPTIHTQTTAHHLAHFIDPQRPPCPHNNISQVPKTSHRIVPAATQRTHAGAASPLSTLRYTGEYDRSPRLTTPRHPPPTRPWWVRFLPSSGQHHRVPQPPRPEDSGPT